MKANELKLKADRFNLYEQIINVLTESAVKGEYNTFITITNNKENKSGSDREFILYTNEINNFTDTHNYIVSRLKNDKFKIKKITNNSWNNINYKFWISWE